MITDKNRIVVDVAIRHLQREVDQFSSFTKAQQFTAGEVPHAQAVELMQAWARVSARQFDLEFQQLAALLGYTVSKIESAEEAA
ncbi:hypothetical protein HFO65_15690 [Rhizobium laguerreae]|uniref:hypothetical protein n=1 Tax=Rhizobium laguerreae TaxID=1076926 RepID=UPI001C90F2B7|nr:hypothetical protein [Rhizobium laguerreae]MBY3162076.1 hypothetical protein [Rhizobium laguerreae]